MIIQNVDQLIFNDFMSLKNKNIMTKWHFKKGLLLFYPLDLRNLQRYIFAILNYQ